MIYKELAELAHDQISAAIDRHYELTGRVPRIITIRATDDSLSTISVEAADVWGVDGPVQDKIDRIRMDDDTATAFVLIIGRRFRVRRGGVAIQIPKT